MTAFDRRLIPARDDLVAEHLTDLHPAAVPVPPSIAYVRASVVDLKPRPDANAVADTQLLFGEPVSVYDTADGWAWIQSKDDGYVGYLKAEHLAFDLKRKATHRIRTLCTNLYAVPSLKTPVQGQLPFAAQITVHDHRDGYALIHEDQWVPEQHITRIDSGNADWVAISEMFRGVPYLWGGRSNLGLDCSALIQLGRQGAGHRCLRDSDMQETSLGETLPEEAPLQRGDLLFWRGHVGVMADTETLLHANGHHMAVVYEPVADAIQRILDAENSPVTRRARLA